MPLKLNTKKYFAQNWEETVRCFNFFKWLFGGGPSKTHAARRAVCSLDGLIDT